MPQPMQVWQFPNANARKEGDKGEIIQSEVGENAAK
jgi:hypothetical protein